MKFAVFDPEGFPVAFYEDGITPQIPAGAVQITDEQWSELLSHSGARRWSGGELVSVAQPPAPAPDRRTAKADIWRRATDDEAVTIAQGLDALPLRKRQIYNEAAYLDHSDPLFDELVAGFVQAFGEARTSELLAASE